jgi:hypothetical protein
MSPTDLRRLLSRHRRGKVSTGEAMAALERLPFTDLGFARLDTHRHLRKGFPEVVFGLGKTQDQIVRLVDELARSGAPVIVTRTTGAVYRAVRKRHPRARFAAPAGVLTLVKGKPRPTGNGTVAVVTAGTSDQPVAEEAAITCEVMGNRVERIYDVGVAGIHRLFHDTEKLRSAQVLIVVAGMEGALPSVVGGLVAAPVIAVPTSAGYGASFGGVAALLAMLNSCASGITVVNIDNGFGAGYAASAINHLR